MEDVTPAPAAIASPVVLFTGEGKARAATFTADEAELAEQAAALMGLRVLRVSTDEHRLVAANLPRGKIFAASSKALVPFCRGQIVAQLNAFPEVFTPERPADTDQPATPPKARKGRHLAAGGGDGAAQGQEPVSEAVKARGDAPALVRVGGLVLAAEDANVWAWYPAKVTAQRGDELLVLQWIDGGDTLVRRRDHVVALPPALAGKLK